MNRKPLNESDPLLGSETFNLNTLLRLIREKPGRLEDILTRPEVYTEAFSHGFMEHAEAARLYIAVQTRIKAEKGTYDPKNPEHNRLWKQYLKEHYLEWANQTLPQPLLELGVHVLGWEAYIHD